MATVAKIEEELAAARQCKLDILKGGQSASIRGKGRSFPSLDAVDKAIALLEKQLAAKRGVGVATSRHGFR
jgi:hypothetical protein